MDFRTQLWARIIKDFKNNFLIVSIPALFTNSSWRLMNLLGIGVTGSPSAIIWDTSYEIAPVIFLICWNQLN